MEKPEKDGKGNSEGTGDGTHSYVQSMEGKPDGPRLTARLLLSYH